MPNFSITTNADEFRRAIEDRRTGVQASVKGEIKSVANDVLETLYGNLDKATTPPRSFTAVKTIKGRPTQPITVERGTIRKALTKSGAENVFELKDYSAKVGATGRAAKVLGWLEEGTPGHGPKRARALRFALPAGVVFARWVKGIRPMRIFKRTQMMYQRIFGGRIRQAVARGLHK